MQDSASSKKGKTIESISICVLRLEISKGHLKWKVTDLESRARVSRSLVYRYLGSTKEEILRNALTNFNASFFGLSADAVELPLSERIHQARVFLIENPEVAMFYQKWRGTETWLARELKNAEEETQRKLKRFHPQLSDVQVLMLHGFLHGLVTAPFLTGDQALAAGKELETLVNSLFRA